jgi:Arc/MetJ family transcription regulator
MIRRTTIEIDDELLNRAKRALGAKTTRATVEEALRRVALEAEGERAHLAAKQHEYLHRLNARIDPDVFASDEMWR